MKYLLVTNHDLDNNATPSELPYRKEGEDLAALRNTDICGENLKYVLISQCQFLENLTINNCYPQTLNGKIYERV